MTTLQELHAVAYDIIAQASDVHDPEFKNVRSLASRALDRVQHDPSKVKIYADIISAWEDRYSALTPNSLW